MIPCSAFFSECCPHSWGESIDWSTWTFIGFVAFLMCEKCFVLLNSYSPTYSNISWCNHQRSRPSNHTSFVKRWTDKIAWRQNTNFKALVLRMYLTLGLKSLHSLEFTSPWPSGKDNTRCYIHSLSWIACFSTLLLQEPVYRVNCTARLLWMVPWVKFSSHPHGLFTELGNGGMRKSKKGKLLSNKVSDVLFPYTG